MSPEIEIWPDIASNGSALRMHLTAHNLYQDGSFDKLIHTR